MLSDIRQRIVVGEDGKIEIQSSELSVGTVVDFTTMTDESAIAPSPLAVRRPSYTFMSILKQKIVAGCQYSRQSGKPDAT